MRQRPFIMLTNVDMILFLQLPSKDKVKIADLAARIFNNLSFEKELQFALRIECPSLFILDMQFREESALEQIRNLISFFGLDLLSQLLNDYFIDVFM